MADDLGRVAYEAETAWLDEIMPGVRTPAWDELDPDHRGVYQRIAGAVAAAERERIRRGVLACELISQHPEDGDRVAVLTLDLERVIGAEDGS